MKICLVAPGEISIPPSGWGALETVVSNQYNKLILNGYEVKIINEKDPNKTYQEIESFDPDIVHLHYGKHFEILPFIHRRKIITNHDGSFLNSIKFHENIIRQFMYDCEFFVLTSWENNLLMDIGLPKNNIKILPNGVDYGSFKKLPKPKRSGSICLGKIDSRKNQQKLQKLNCDVVFVGQNSDTNFNALDPNYLGEWKRHEVYENLTDYTNLVLLSNSELQPLVCLEALSAGLGLVISEQAAQNLYAVFKTTMKHA
jgi:glycosyltransferase involved in cell wall biosynthesis